MNITCKVCKNSLPLKQEVLHKHKGKVVAFKCPRCSNNIRFRVEANPDSPKKRPSELETVVSVSPRKSSDRDLKSYLKVLSNDQTREQIFQLTSGILAIGRLSNKENAPRPDIPIETSDMRMSKLHCTIVVEAHKNGTRDFILKNHQNSKNKTKKDDKVLEDYDGIYLKDGDFFEIGRTTILFYFGR